MHASWAVLSVIEAVGRDVATNDDVEATRGHHGRSSRVRLRRRGDGLRVDDLASTNEDGSCERSALREDSTYTTNFELVRDP